MAGKAQLRGAARRGLPTALHARLVVLVHQLLDVGELLVEVLEAGVGLLARRVRPRSLELVSDPCLHLLQRTSVSQVQGAGYRVLVAGCWLLDAECWVQGAECWVQGAGCEGV